MALNFKKIWNGLKIVKKSLDLTPAVDASVGDLEVLSDGKIYYRDDLTSSPLVTETHTAVLENKSFLNTTFDAEGTGNTLSNIKNSNIKAAAAIDASKIANGTVSNTSFQYVSGVTSSIQSQIDSKANQTALDTHTSDTSNPHSVTKAQVGLSNVPNVDATDRANHTGTQLASTISDFSEAVDNRTSNFVSKTGDVMSGTLSVSVPVAGTSNLGWQGVTAQSADFDQSADYTIDSMSIYLTDPGVSVTSTVILPNQLSVVNQDTVLGTTFSANIQSGRMTLASSDGMTTSPTIPSLPEEVTTKAYVDAAIAAGGGGSVAVKEEGSTVIAAAASLNFIGATVTVTDAGSSQANITITSSGAVPSPTTFSLLANQPAPVDVTALSYNPVTDLGFILEYTIYATGSPSDFPVIGRLRGIYNTTGGYWETSTDYAGVDGGFTLSITTLGQVQYTSGARAGTLNYIKLITYPK